MIQGIHLRSDRDNLSWQRAPDPRTPTSNPPAPEAGGVIFTSPTNPSITREDYAAKLTRPRHPHQAEEVVKLDLRPDRYLGRPAPGAKVFVMGELPFVAEMARPVSI